MGGLLSMPLNARKIYAFDRNPDQATIQNLLELGTEWIVWDCYNQWAPVDEKYEEVPKIIQDITLEELVFQTPWECDFRFLRLR